MSGEVVIGMRFLKSRETKEAVYGTEITDGMRYVYLPKSQIDCKECDDGSFTVSMPRWLAKDKNLV